MKTYEASMDKSEKQARQHTGEEVSGPSIRRGKSADTKAVNPYPTPRDMGEFIGHLKENLPSLAVDGQSETLILEKIETSETQLKSAKPKKQLIMAAMQNLKGALTNSLFNAGVRFLLSRLRELM